MEEREKRKRHRGAEARRRLANALPLDGPADEDLIGRADLASWFGVSERTIKRQEEAGVLPTAIQIAGPRWLAREGRLIRLMRIAGKSDEELRQFAALMVQARAQAMPKLGELMPQGEQKVPVLVHSATDRETTEAAT